MKVHTEFYFSFQWTSTVGYLSWLLPPLYNYVFQLSTKVTGQLTRFALSWSVRIVSLLKFNWTLKFWVAPQARVLSWHGHQSTVSVVFQRNMQPSQGIPLIAWTCRYEMPWKVNILHISPSAPSKATLFSGKSPWSSIFRCSHFTL